MTARSADRAVVVADVASRLVGSPVEPGNVIGETLVRVTTGTETNPDELRASIANGVADEPQAIAADARAEWVKSTFGVVANPPTGNLLCQLPTMMIGAAGKHDDLRHQHACPLRSSLHPPRGRSLRHPRIENRLRRHD